TITPSIPASANMKPLTAAIFAKVLVLADPRPPWAPRINASPVKTGTSLSGILICGADTNQLDLGNCLDGRIIFIATNDCLRRLAVQAVSKLLDGAQSTIQCVRLATSQLNEIASYSAQRLVIVTNISQFHPEGIPEWFVALLSSGIRVGHLNC